jgi:hypothetical protein
MSAKPRGRKVFLRNAKRLQLGQPVAPMRAVLLNLDAAQRTGFALFLDGTLREYGALNALDPDARRAVLREAMHTAEVRARPLALICEAPFGGHLSAALSLTATVALWRDSWKQLRQPPGTFLEITVGQWRRALFGRHGLSRKQARELEQHAARARACADMPFRAHYRIDADAAAAICMGQVTARAGGVLEALRSQLTREGKL